MDAYDPLYTPDPDEWLALDVPRTLTRWRADFTGGLGTPTEAAAMRDLALDAGILDEHIILEPTATTTLENAVLSSRLMSQHGYSSALIVSDRFHLPRAVLVFRCLGVDARGAGVATWLPGPLRAWWRYPIYEACAFIWYAAMVRAGRHRRIS